MQGITLLLMALAIYGTTVEGLKQELRDHILKVHNDYRKNERGACQMERMEYDLDLERQATEWANKCVFKHEIIRGRGENLAWNTAVKPESELMTDAAKAWYDEINLYSYGQYSCGSACHYTQMVWDKTNRVGCATKNCRHLVNAYNDAWYLVCFYTPAGNMNGEKPYQRSCSTPCKEGQTENSEGLCVGALTETGANETETNEGNGEQNDGTGEEEITKTDQGNGEQNDGPGEEETTKTDEGNGEDNGGTEEEEKVPPPTVEESTDEDSTVPTTEAVVTTRRAPTTTEEESSEEEPCEDKDSRCEKWAKWGECHRNPGYMDLNCAKACANCGDECKDVHGNCASWAKDAQCQKNPSYMLRYCQLSCNAC